MIDPTPAWNSCVAAFLFKWQTLFAGLLGFAAAIFAVLIALGSERRKTNHTLTSVKRALGVEIRQYSANAYRAHLRCLTFLTRGEERTHAVEVNDAAMLPVPSVYPAVVTHIGEFGACAPQVVLFYNRIVVAREAAQRLLQHPKAEHLPSAEVANAADALIKIAQTGTGLLGALKTGIDAEDDYDATAIARTAKVSEDWKPRRKVYGLPDS